MVHSRNKGARAERELASAIGDVLGVKMRRGQQFCGLTGAADVVGWEGVHVECKRVERLNLSQAMEQSVRDAREGEVPIVCHRKNREGWMVTVRLEDLRALAARVMDTDQLAG